MPIGEVIAELVLQPLLELVFYGLFYWTGYGVLKALSLGRLRLAPLSSISGKNRRKKKWHQIDWSIWLHLPLQGKRLKAEVTCMIGMLTWAMVGFGVYWAI